MQRLLLALVGCMFSVGCTTLPPELQVGHEPVWVTMTETAEKLGLSIEETDYWGERHLVAPSGDTVLIRRECSVYWFNGLTREVEFPGIKGDGIEFRFPLGMYNSICKDFGRIELLRDELPRYDRPQEVLNALRKPIQPHSKKPAVQDQSLAGMTIVVDPGHGGKDPGAIGVGGVYEKTIAMTVGREVSELLEARGATVILTRSNNDSYPTLSERAKLANSKKADLFISIHANASDNSDAEGIETWFHPGGSRGTASQRLAQNVNDRMVGATNAKDRGTRAANFHVIKNTDMPAILVELGFLTNASEAKNLSSASYQDKLAGAIVEGVLANQASKASLSR